MDTRACSAGLRLSLAFVASLLLCVVVLCFSAEASSLEIWKKQWPKTDFSRHSVPLDEIRSGGPGKDGIPSIDRPRFVATVDVVADAILGGFEPVIALEVNGDIRAYPLRIMIWHEIVNDVVGGVPVAITYCPLCNSAIVFDRRVNGRVLDFGTTGNLRHSDLVMYDRQTESWWQQFLGEGIVGEMTGVRLKALPARVEAFHDFTYRGVRNKVMAPPGNMRPYGQNPYVGYDSSARPFLYDGELPEGIAPMAYVLVVGDQAWTLELIKRRERIEAGDLVISWHPGQSSVLDSADIAKGRDIGNIDVQRRMPGGATVGVVHDLTFAFVFHAFHKDGRLHK